MSCLTCALLWGLMLEERGEPAHCISLSVRWQPVIVAQGDQDSVNSQFRRPSSLFFPPPSVDAVVCRRRRSRSGSRLHPAKNVFHPDSLLHTK